MADGNCTWVSPREFAERFGVSENCVRQLCRQQDLGAKRVGRNIRIPLEFAIQQLPNYAASPGAPEVTSASNRRGDERDSALDFFGLRQAA